MIDMKTKYLTPELATERLYDIDVITASGEVSSNESSSTTSGVVENSILNAWWG